MTSRRFNQPNECKLKILKICDKTVFVLSFMLHFDFALLM